MKFAELPPGARFLYEGREHVKTGPLTATEVATGRQRLIPRYAAAAPLDCPARPLGPPRLAQAWAEFRAECRGLFTEPSACRRFEEACARFEHVLYQSSGKSKP